MFLRYKNKRRTDIKITKIVKFSNILFFKSINFINQRIIIFYLQAAYRPKQRKYKKAKSKIISQDWFFIILDLYKIC